MDYETSNNRPAKRVQLLPGVVCLKIREARTTGWLSLNGIKLRNVPPDVCKKLRHLHHLYLSGCRLIAFVPAELQVLSKLVVLDLSNNSFTDVPRCLFLNLKYLKTLDLSDNKLTGLPHTIDQLASLEELCVAENKIVSLPFNIGRLAHLKTLDASSNLLREISADFLTGKMKQSLTCLRLSGNQLQTLPRQIGVLTNLEELDISNNNMSHLPVTAKSLLHLQVFHHRGNNWLTGSEESSSKGSYGSGALVQVYSLIYSLR